MPDSKLTQLSSIYTQKLVHLKEMWPELVTRLNLESMSLDASITHTHKPLIANDLLLEEKQRLHTLLLAQTALPAQAIAQDSKQAFESLLTQWLGFTVTCYPHNISYIPYHHGKARAIPYFATHNSTTKVVPEAGTSRHTYSWQINTHENLDYQLFLHPSSLLQNSHDLQQKPWFIGKTAIVIEPQSLTVVAATIADLLPEHASRYQFGTSPGLTRLLGNWLPKKQGIISVFYTEETLQPGSFTSLNPNIL